MTYIELGIRFIFRALAFIVLIDVILSFFMSPYSQIRMILDKIVEPMLRPIKRIIPPFGNLDFSPVILLLVLQLVEFILLRVI